MERNLQRSNGTLLSNDLADELNGIVGDLLAEACKQQNPSTPGATLLCVPINAYSILN